MKPTEDFKENINNSLKEIQENTGKQLEALQEETQKSLKELQENTTKQAKELNKIIQDLKMEVETIKNKIQKKKKGDNSGDRNPRKETRNHRYKYHQQNTRDGRENLRCRRFHRKLGHNNQRKCKMQKDPNSKHPGNPGHNGKTKTRDNRYS